MKEEWRIFETKNPKLKDKFLCGFIDLKKTEARKCVRCKSVFSCKKSNTSDIERAFSYAKYLKKDIQSRLKTENFTRNVFLKLTEECV